MDRIGSFFAEKTPRRVMTLAIFVGLIVLFRELAVLLVFFVAFERLLGAGSRAIAERTGIRQKWALLGQVAVLLAAVGGGVALGVGRILRGIEHARLRLPERLAEIKETPLYLRLTEHVHDADKYLENAKQYSGGALHAVAAVGHVLLYALIGLILAVIYHLEHEELERFANTLEPRSLYGTLLRWLGHLADAVHVTIKVQLVVAGCNAILTLPVLLFLRLPHLPTLVLMIFVTSLVPVIGNFISGAVLCLLAFHVRGWVGVGIFVVLTFVLHKLESYYLNPLLTSRHVHLPGFVIIVSLIAWEHLLGFAGLFVSFPVLFVSARILSEMRAEDAVATVIETPEAPPAE